MSTVIEVADSSKWEGHADAVLTNPYARLPSCVLGLPSIISLYHRDEKEMMTRHHRTEGWLDAPLYRLSSWGRGLQNTVYVANLPVRVIELEDLIESHDPYVEGVGWFPLSLPLRLLRLYSDIIKPPMVVADLFCGRGTVAKACTILGLSSVSLDNDPERIKIAKQYLAQP